MLRRPRKHTQLTDRGPLRALFVITSMPVGGAETLLVNLAQRFDPDLVLPEICCLKELGPLGEQIANHLPTHSHLLTGKYDVRVLSRLQSLIRNRRIDAVITVGAGDKMFWGRLAAWLERVPVICSALHSTGWPDTIGPLNRILTPVTDAFIAVAERHGNHLYQVERFPQHKVCVIPNGIDTERFRPRNDDHETVRVSLGIPSTAPVCGIVAALRPEKNHELFIRAAAQVRQQLPEAHFMIIGDGPERSQLETLGTELQLSENLHFLGSRADIPEILATLNLFSLTSHNEANPVSILEALSTEVPVVATRVGSVEETVQAGVTGFLVDPGDQDALAERWLELLSDESKAHSLGKAGRQLVVETSSLDQMVAGYESLICETYSRKCETEKHLQTREHLYS